ncbi:glutaredoxin family protein [Janthinobacterium sp. 17J80-10]|uniref:glutaredoxin family protein n=1 Tax=Janthinobacterium sp. 17J80-10 TaxID=2497863 RepID=UPI001005591B|nr:glutaredoxin family protein [Janthinobacterium sp. 17J80-10]QAU33881.1 glutaredoxin family protein [Janthinobacterium sp. 17J80-10]
MNSTASVLVLTMLLAAGAAHAQLYKWVGPDGKITYSDVPPPKTAKQVEQKDIASAAGGASAAGLPYELAQAVRNHPVTLYTGDKCEPCEEARSYLKQRGVPFAEKTVTTNDDIARLKQAVSESRLPAVTIGRDKHTGFESGAWGATLSAAGYPQTSTLPKTYRQPAAEAAAPKAKIEKAAQRGQASANGAETPATSAPPAVGNAPPGFRF